jgi:hypothetical protein
VVQKPDQAGRLQPRREPLRDRHTGCDQMRLTGQRRRDWRAGARKAISAARLCGEEFWLHWSGRMRCVMRRCGQGEAVCAVSQGKCGLERRYEEEVERLYAGSRGRRMIGREEA